MVALLELIPLANVDHNKQVGRKSQNKLNKRQTETIQKFTHLLESDPNRKKCKNWTSKAKTFALRKRCIYQVLQFSVDLEYNFDR